MTVSFELLLLLANAATQFLCIRGVNMLTSTSSALTMCMVLNFRKLLNLLLSRLVFGTATSGSFLAGSCLVFGSVVSYALDEYWRIKGRNGNLESRDD